jgi:CheY-like chemotaxis protein
MIAKRAPLSVRVPDKARVLVIDDYEDLRSVLAATLRCVGYEVMEASNGRLGLEACRAWTPALVLLDYEMPIMNGVEFLQAKAADPAHRARLTSARQGESSLLALGASQA